MIKIIIALAVIVVLAVAFGLDVRSWRIKSLDELLAMASGSDWRYWKPALKELKRRGQDINPYAPQIIEHLLSPDKFTRGGARMTLLDLYPRIGKALGACGYSVTDAPDVSRQKLASMLTEHLSGA